MPTLAPGANSEAPATTGGPGKVRGFTLVEMLVVLMVMGIFLGLVTVRMGVGEKDVLRNEAERLAQILDLAAEEARITGKSIAWTAEASEYRFWRLGTDNEWMEIRDNDLFRARALAPGVAISDLRVEAMRALNAMRVEFPPGGAMLAFTIDLSLGSAHYEVAASPVGEIRVSAGKGNSYAEMAPQ
jgi:general secretion pathway protein H